MLRDALEEKQDVVWNYEGEKIELDPVCRDLEVLEEERLVQLESGDEVSQEVLYKAPL